MRILLGTANIARSSGGVAESVRNLAGALGAFELEVRVLAGSAAEANAGKGADTTLNCATAGVFVKDLEPVVRDLFQGGLPAIVHDNGVWALFHHRTARIARRWRVPRIVAPRGMLEPWAVRRKALKKRVAWLAYQRSDLQDADVLHATAAQEAANLRDLGLEAPIAVVPNGVRLPAASALRSGDGAPGGKSMTALFLSRIHPKKGLLNLIQAWHVTRPEGWKLVIAGPDEGDHRHEVEAAAHRLGLAGVVDFRGPVYGKAKEELLRSADLFVLPTFSENFGIVVAEALAWEVPVITTRGAPWAELEAEGCGWWTEIGVEPLAAALREAAELSGEELRRMGRRGRTLVERQFTLERTARDLIAVYRWVLGEGHSPDCLFAG